MGKRRKLDPLRYEAMRDDDGPRSPGTDTVCGKKGYPDSVTADRVRAHQEERSGAVLDIYCCFDCGLWHLTSGKVRRT